MNTNQVSESNRTTRKILWLSHLGLGVFILIIALLYVFPIAYLLNVTFKTSEEFMANPLTLAKSIQFENYQEVLRQSGFIRSFFNSVLYTATATIITLFVTALAAFMISRKYVRFSGFLYILFMAGIFLPNPLIPQFRLILGMGLYNNPIGYILLRLNPGILMLLMVGYYKTIPRDFDEAAGLEGCGTVRYIVQFLLPLSKPVFATGAILFSIGIWNDIILTTIFLTSPKFYPIVRALFKFVGQYGNDWPPLAAAVFIVAAPMILVFLFFQRYMIEGVVAAGVKG
jgi:raffinose/stachyose/melibiose transport system permease protein